MHLSEMRAIDLEALNVLNMIAPASHRDIAPLMGVSEATAHRIMQRLRISHAIEFHSFEYSREKASRPRHQYVPVVLGPIPKTPVALTPEQRKEMIAAANQAREDAHARAAAAKQITDPWGRPINKGAI